MKDEGVCEVRRREGVLKGLEEKVEIIIIKGRKEVKEKEGEA